MLRVGRSRGGVYKYPADAEKLPKIFLKILILTACGGIRFSDKFVGDEIHHLQSLDHRNRKTLPIKKKSSFRSYFDDLRVCKLKLK